MNPTQMRNLLSNPARVGETFGNGGWRPHVFTRYADLYDEIAALDPAEIGEAVEAAQTEPDGWAHRLRAWCKTQEICVREAVRQRRPDEEDQTPVRYCSTTAYVSLTAAATAYMLIDLRSLSWHAETELRRRAEEAETKPKPKRARKKQQPAAA